MVNVTPKHTHFSLPIQVQFLAIPTRWTMRNEKATGERCFVPSVNQSVERLLPKVADPEQIRKELFRLEPTGSSAIEFLNGVGVWSCGKTVQAFSALDEKSMPEPRILGAFGHRWMDGWAGIETTESLQAEQHHWRELKRSRSKLRAAFAPVPSTKSAPYLKDRFAIESLFGNTLPIHLEWRGKHPHAVIQPVTGRELLIALAWFDLVTGAECKVCQNENCGVEYTHGGRKFCSLNCEHANTTRAYRRRLKEKTSAKKSL